MNTNEIKIQLKSQLRDKLAEARQRKFMSQPGQKEAYYDGKASAFAEAIEAVEEVEADQ